MEDVVQLLALACCTIFRGRRTKKSDTRVLPGDPEDASPAPNPTKAQKPAVDPAKFSSMLWGAEDSDIAEGRGTSAGNEGGSAEGADSASGGQLEMRQSEMSTGYVYYGSFACIH